MAFRRCQISAYTMSYFVTTLSSSEMTVPVKQEAVDSDEKGSVY